MRLSQALLAGLVPAALASSSTGQSTTDEDAFDYIVIGSGPGGGPLAVNLAEAGHSVLLLEAGQNHTSSENQQIPALFGSAQWDEDQGWFFYTKHYDNETLAAQNSKMVWEKPDGEYWVGLDPPEGSTMLGIWYPRAGTLGGCDTHNGGLTVLPSDWDWDNVADVTGDESWRSEAMLQYYTRIERNLHVAPGTPGHGFDGYQPVDVGNKSLYEREPQLLAVAQGTAFALGHENRSLSPDLDVVAKNDINRVHPGRDTEDDIYQISFKKDEMGRRYSAGNRVSDGAASGIPLTVRFDSLVTKINVDDDLRATGVQYLEGEKLYKADPRHRSNHTGIPRSARANREVVVAGGTFNTPQLLMLSGIGPAEHLAEHGIDVKVDLPGVGRNLQDHYEVPVMHQFANNFTYWKRCDAEEDQEMEDNPCYLEWLANGTGEWSTLGFMDFVTYTSSVAPRGERDVILYGVGSPVLGHLPPYTNWTGVHEQLDLFTYTLSESHMRNKAGRITLRSDDPTDVPDIHFSYFEGDGAEEDIQGLVDAIGFTREIFDSVTDVDMVGEQYPGREVSTQEELAEFVKSEAFGHHASGTASIGSDDDPLAVLDSEFRVRGVEGLRVVDASVFPEVPGTFPLIAIFMVSEKASDVIAAAAV